MESKTFTNVAYITLAVILTVGLGFLISSRLKIQKEISAAEEAARLANIELTLITPSDCEECVSVDGMVEYIQKQTVNIVDKQNYSSNSKEGQNLIDQYKITTLPAIIIAGEYNKNNVSDFFANLATKSNEDNLIWEMKSPVYYDLEKSAPVGLIEITYLTYSACSECYNPTVHRDILEKNFGAKIGNEISVDYNDSEGRALISKYNITQVPTIILSSDTASYPRLSTAWQTVGSIEEDGNYVFRKNEAMNEAVYYDLTTNSIITP
ncbi:hypothetical protein D6827_02130 [Candidatus Parcubacteria bacterium]|nr:MAG: hypothetical protein D6827_02130 [Candidatus Parcubacteria bacterium]